MYYEIGKLYKDIHFDKYFLVLKRTKHELCEKCDNDTKCLGFLETAGDSISNITPIMCFCGYSVLIDKERSYSPFLVEIEERI